MPDTPTSDTRAASEAFLPLTPASFHILLVLADGPTHGYAIMREVERLTRGALHLGPGTLYRSIQRLLDDALIAEVSGAVGVTADERRTYRLTALGHAVACAESMRLAVLVRVARRRGLLGSVVRVPRRGATP